MPNANPNQLITLHLDWVSTQLAPYLIWFGDHPLPSPGTSTSKHPHQYLHRTSLTKDTEAKSKRKNQDTETGDDDDEDPVCSSIDLSQSWPPNRL